MKSISSQIFIVIKPFNSISSSMFVSVVFVCWTSNDYFPNGIMGLQVA